MTDDERDGPVDYGMELCGVMESEDDLQEWLELVFEDAGWTAIREVSPHCSDYRADLIVKHDEHGWFGIETKYIGSSQGPIDMAKAHHQIVEKYRGKNYIGNHIDLWCVCPYIKYSRTEDMRRPSQVDDSWRWMKSNQIESMRPFFQHAGIGWMNLNHYSLDMQFIESDSAGTIPVGQLAQTEKVQRNKDRYQSITDSRADGCDVSQIRSWAANKVQEAPYGRPRAVETNTEADE